jgi:hypothetical protein
MEKNTIGRSALIFALAFWCVIGTAKVGAEETATYVGSEVCAECHEDEFASYTANAKKAHSYGSVALMKQRGRLTDSEYKECLHCHSTGFGRPGGFVSVEATPHLKNAGCEVCHGPGSIHADSMDPEDIKGSLTVEDCTTCHNAERVNSFRFRPLIYGGGH